MTGDSEDPVAKARAAARQPLPKRFYKHAAVAETEGRYRVELDGRQVRTPLRRVLEVPSRAVAEALAREWQQQTDVIDPATMPLTRLVNAALDAVAGREAAVRADIVKYAGSDLVCYRAEHPQTLVARQAEGWDPILAWARDTLGADLLPAKGIVHQAQPAAALERIASAIGPLPALTLAALHSATTLTGSALLALACHAGRIDGAQAWRLAHIDEDYQAEQWGWDSEAQAARDRKRAQMDAAALVLTALPNRYAV